MLIEVLVAMAIFVFVAVAGFETMRALGSGVDLLAQRSGANARLATVMGQLESDATSASAVWTPNSLCGAAVSMMRRDAAGTSFTTYVVRNGMLVRAGGPGPIDPCDPALATDTVLDNVASITTAALAANNLPAHIDPVSGSPDGALFRGGIPVVAVDAHALDYDGSHILTGNGIVELTIDASPAQVTVDLLAGNRPNGYTNVLTYACGYRCEANTMFPEVSSLDYATCTANTPDLPDSSAFYAASSTTLSATGRIVTTAYAVHLRYSYTFAGGASSPLTVYRIGPTVTWPASANLSDAYPVDYTANAVRALGAPALATLFGPPPTLASATAVCAGMNAETDFRG